MKFNASFAFGILPLIALSFLAASSPAAAAENANTNLPIVRIQAPDPTALEGGSTGAFTVTRNAAGNSDLAVQLKISGTAVNGVDYSQLTIPVVIPAGLLAADIIVQPIDNGLIDDNKTVTLTLITNANYNLETHRQATVTIVDNRFNDLPPKVNLLSPTNGAFFAKSANLTLLAEASDSDNAVSKVSFFANDLFLGSVTNSPYTLVWSNAPPGHYSLFAKATDALGATGLSSPARITISNAPPVVSLVSPTNGAVFATPANIALQAEATDSDDAIGKVSFYANEKLVGSVTNAPYSLVWSNALPGHYRVVAKATDAFGAAGYSTSVKITVSNALPVVHLLSPTNGAVFAMPANIALQAEATDSDDAIRKVSFYANDKLIGSVTNAPYSLVWSNALPGSYSVFAKATDAFGLTGYSQSAKIVVGNAPPIVDLLSPTNGMVFTPPANITLKAQATDSDGAVSKVSFYANERLVGSVTNAPYILVWSNVLSGHYSLLAKATDQFGKAGYSKTVRIAVSNAPPIVNLLSPTNGTVFTPPTNVTLLAEATDSDDTIGKLSFYANEKLIGSLTNAPYSLVWSNVPPGNYSLLAKATDQFGKIGYSKTVKIVVSNAPPIVRITSPTNQTIFVWPTNVTLTAEASDADDKIQKVSFYANDHFLGSLTNSPYSLVWSNAPPGAYKLTAQATDQFGLKVSSPPVVFVVVAFPPLPVTAFLAASSDSGSNVQISSVVQLPSGEYQLNVTGPSGSKVTIESSSNCVDWTPLGTLENATGSLQYLDQTAAGHPHQFYRAILAK